MEHSERIKIAKAAANKIVSKYKKDIIYICIYGSTARSEDVKNSDIELIVVSKTKDSWKPYPLKDVNLWVAFKTKKQLYSELSHPGWGWLYRAGQVLYGITLYDEDKLLEKIRHRIAMLEGTKFKDAAKDQFQDSIEFKDKIADAVDMSSIEKARLYIPALLDACNAVIFLVNKKPFPGNYLVNINSVRRLKLAPPGYSELALAMLRANTIKEVGSLNEKIWSAYSRFANKNGIKTKRYGTVAEVNF